MAREPVMGTYRLYSVNDLVGSDEEDGWIVRRMIPRESRVVFYGAGGEFKSTVAFDLSVAVASGTTFMEEFPLETFGPTVVISTEGNLSANRKRVLSHVRARNMHPGQVQMFYGQEELELDTPGGQRMLEKIVDQLRPVQIVLDPFVSFFGGDENNVSEVKRFFKPINKLIRNYKMTCIVVHHANARGRLRGSTGLQAWADTVLRFDKVKKVTIPSVAEPVDIVTASLEKMRNAADDGKWSFVPLVDEVGGTVSFGIYDSLDAPKVGAVVFKWELYKMLCMSGPLTEGQIREQMSAGQPRVKAGLEALRRIEMVRSVPVFRPSGEGRLREVWGWEAVKVAKVDVVRDIMKKNKQRNPDDCCYAVDDRDEPCVCLPRAPEGSRVPRLRSIGGGRAD